MQSVHPHHQGLSYPTGRTVRGLARQNHLRGGESIAGDSKIKTHARWVGG